MKQFLNLLICVFGFSIVGLKGQDVIIESNTLTLEDKKSEVSIIGNIRKNLYLSEKTSNGKYYILLQDRSKNDKPVKKIEVELPEDSKVEDTDFFSFEIAQDKLYLFTISRDRKNRVKQYKGIAYDTLLNTSIDWTVLLDLNSGKKNGIELMDSYESVSFWKDELVFVILDSDNGKKVDGNITSSIPEYFDLSLANVEFDTPPIDLSDISFKIIIGSDIENFEPDYEAKDKYKVDHSFDEIDGKEVLWVTLMSPNEQGSKNASPQTFYYSMIDAANEERINEGKIYTLPENISSDNFSISYHKDEIFITCYYKDNKDKKSALKGVMCIIYNVDSREVKNVVFNEFSPKLKELLNNNKKISKGEFYPLKITHNNNGTFSVLTSFETLESESSGNAFSSKVKENNSYTWEDLFCFHFDASGKLVFESFVTRYAKLKTKERLFPSANYIMLKGKEGKPVIIITDNIKNYSNGLLSSNNKKNEFDETTCIAFVNWSGEQKVLIPSVEKEFGVGLYPNCIYSLDDNEYIWFGYKDGIGKIITFKLD
ncbi:MAG: hypothetical protein ACO1PI_13860 [Bacteroidota bacterium]